MKTNSLHHDNHFSLYHHTPTFKLPSSLDSILLYESEAAIVPADILWFTTYFDLTISLALVDHITQDYW